MPGDFWEGQNHFSLLVQTTLWLAVLSGDESKAWHEQGTWQVLPCMRSILFFSVFSKPSRMRVFTVDSLLSMGRKARVGRRSWGFLLFLCNRPEDCSAYGIPLRNFRGLWNLFLHLRHKLRLYTESKVKAALCFDHVSAKTHCNQSEE